MPYVLAALATLLAILGLYQFMLKATPRQIKSLFLSAAVLALAVAILLLALTGRLPAVFGLVAGLAPFVMAIWKTRNNPMGRKSGHVRPPRSGDLTRAEALEILGLSGEPDEEAIQTAYKHLMKSMHPDQQGSPWVAERLNAARDRLLKSKKR